MAESYTDTQSIARRLYNVYKLEGATGNISLNSKGDPIKEVSVNMISADGHKSVYVVVPNWGD
jgi:ABC-type branched-subunit amino acid transport system substrate-binding protein